MRSAFIIISFFASLALAGAPDWQPLARKLLSEGAESQTARQQLLSLKPLEPSLINALDAGGDEEQLALLVIRKLRLKSFINELLSRVTKYDPLLDRCAPYVLALITFTDENDPGDLIVDELLKKIPVTSAKISAALRISVVTAAINRDKILPAKELIELLEDPSYEMRIKAVEAADLASKKAPKDYLPFFKRSLFVTPFPVRLKTAEAIDGLSVEDKMLLKSDIEKCAHSDANESVRLACKSVRF